MPHLNRSRPLACGRIALGRYASGLLCIHLLAESLAVQGTLPGERGNDVLLGCTDRIYSISVRATDDRIEIHNTKKSQLEKLLTYSAKREKGNCQKSVGRWGLLLQNAALCLALKTLICWKSTF